jgi:hypothetical protein
MDKLPPTDAVLVLKSWNWGLIPARRKELEAWVEAGGRLILDRSVGGGVEEFEQWSGLRFEDAPEEYASEKPKQGADEDEDEDDDADDAEQAPDTRGPSILLDIFGPCRTVNVSAGEPPSDPTRTSYDLCGMSWGRSWITTTHSPEWALKKQRGGMQVVRVGIGRGKLTLIDGSPFNTREILRGDNGALFVDATLLRRGDLVVFVSDEGRASLLELIWMLGAPAVLLAAALLALALWRNAARFGPLEAAPDSARRSLAEQIRGTGRFVLRIDAGRPLHAAMVNALHEAARQRIARYERLSTPDRLAAIAKIAGIDADRLAQTVNFSGKRSPHEFRNAIELLDRARAAIIAHKGTVRHATVAPDTIAPGGTYPDSS